LITNGYTEAAMPKLNLDIRTGGWRPIDLKRDPFNLPGDYVHWFVGEVLRNVFLWKNPDAPPLD